MRNIYDPDGMGKMGFEYVCVGRGEKRSDFRLMPEQGRKAGGL